MKLILSILAAIGMIVAGNKMFVACSDNNLSQNDVVVIEEPTNKECPPVVITADYERKDILEVILSLKGWDQPIEWVVVTKPIQIIYPNQNGSGYIEGFRINGADIPYSKTLLGKTQKILNKFSDHSVSEQKVLIEDLICSEQLRLLDTELERAKCDDEPTLAPTPPVTPDGDDKGSGFSFPWWILWLLLAIALILFLLWLLSQLRGRDWERSESGSDRIAPVPADDDEEEEEPCSECRGCKNKCHCCCCKREIMVNTWSDTMSMLSKKEGSFSAEMQNGEFKISVSSTAEQSQQTLRRKK